MALFRSLFPAAGALLVAVSALGAQTTEPACQADASKGNLAKASFAFEQLRTTLGTPAAPTSLGNMVKATEAAAGEDSVVQALYLGQTLSLWMGQPTIGYSATRRKLGFVKNPDATLDLVTSVDSLFSVVEKVKPGCAEFINQYRANQGYVNLIQAGFAALNAGKLDSAEYFATRATRLVHGSPHATALLGSIASRRNDTPKAIAYWTAAAATAAKDTALRELQLQALGSAALANLNAALSATGPAQVTTARAAAKQYSDILAVTGQKPDELRANRQNYQLAVRLAADTAAVVASYMPMLANPSAYHYRELYEAAFNAARIGRTADVPKLFEATVTANPYMRDALYFLATSYTDAGQNEKVVPVINRLIVLDPSGKTNFDVAMNAFLALQNSQKSRTSPAAKAYYDSATAWHDRGNRLGADVSLDQYATTDKTLTVTAVVTDRRDAVQPAAKGAKKVVAPKLPPKAITINFEALDKDGKVVGTRSVTTEALAPGAKAKIAVTIDAPNAMGYRYTVAP